MIGDVTWTVTVTVHPKSSKKETIGLQLDAGANVMTAVRNSSSMRITVKVIGINAFRWKK